MSTSGRLVTRNYSQFRGVDFSNRKDEISILRSPDALNMWKNYKNSNGKCIETRPEAELLGEFSSPIYGLFFYGTGTLTHAGTKLYDGTDEQTATLLYDGLAEQKSNFFVFNGKVYIHDGEHYLVWDDTVHPVEGYVPTTTISRSPSGGGVKYEDVNLITPKRINSFCADGTSTIYELDTKGIDSVIKVTVNDVEVSNYTVNTTDGKVTFTTAPASPLTTGQDNVFIEFSKTTEGYANEILKCRLIEVFDNRVFASGNPDNPNYLWHCSLDDPTYWSDLDYYQEGEEDSAITSLVSGNNALWVLKQPSKSNTTIFYHTPTIDSEYGKIYPSSHSSITTGCKYKGINFKDTICFYSENGLEAITSDITTEQTLTHKSSLVDSRLLNENLENMRLTVWEDYLVTLLGNKVYLANYREWSEVNGHNEYEWYYWEFNQTITDAVVDHYSTGDNRGMLVLMTTESTKEGTKYRFYGLKPLKGGGNVESYWTTLADEMGYPQYQKITNKKGCVIDMEGKEVYLYAKTDNKPFDLIKKYINVKGYVVPRIKKKKWKSLQLKFYSKKPFQLYSGTLESYIGSYIKR
jgi:hypothetical protein